jgi:hypothetical protein
MITDEHYQDLMNNKAVRSAMSATKTKVIRVRYNGTHIRIKVTESHSIAIRDTDHAFVKALFPAYFERYELRMGDPDKADVREVIRFMRLRMELRRNIMEIALSAPRETLKFLNEEHANER